MDISKCLYCGKELIVTSTFHEAGRNRKAFTVTQSGCDNCSDCKDCQVVFDEDGFIFFDYIKKDMLYRLTIEIDRGCEFSIAKKQDDSTNFSCLSLSYLTETTIIELLVNRQQLNPQTYTKFMDKKFPLILTFI